MNIALIGYGKMGKEIERTAEARKIPVRQIFTHEEHGSGITRKTLSGVDVCIDFSVPAAVPGNVAAVAECGTSIVIGTTGWYGALDELKELVLEKEIGLLYSPNFSIGMNIFYETLSAAARFFDKFEQYDVGVAEIHHRGKRDNPSGTALAIGQILLEHVGR